MNLPSVFNTASYRDNCFVPAFSLFSPKHRLTRECESKFLYSDGDEQKVHKAVSAVHFATLSTSMLCTSNDTLIVIGKEADSARDTIPPFRSRSRGNALRTSGEAMLWPTPLPVPQYARLRNVIAPTLLPVLCVLASLIARK
jgi:hypothetical protein